MLRIQEAREARGWTQEQLANALGTTQQTIQRWESGAIDPKASKILEISEALGITASFILGVRNSPNDSQLTASEIELLDAYRCLDDRDKKHLLSFARVMAED